MRDRVIAAAAKIDRLRRDLAQAEAELDGLVARVRIHGGDQRTLEQRLTAALEGGASHTARQLATVVGAGSASVRTTLWRMVRAGVVRKVDEREPGSALPDRYVIASRSPT